MRAVVYPSDRAACGHYRAVWPALALRAAGHQVSIRPEDPLDADADVFVIQRPMYGHLAHLIERIRAEGKAVVVDIDDDLMSVHAQNVGWDRLHPRRNARLNWRWAQAVCRQATLVTCSTPALAERYGGGRGRVIPNYVPERFLDVRAPEHERVRLGWAGAVVTHPDDLQATGNAFARLGYRLDVVGPGDGVATALGVPADRVEATGWVQFDDYPQAVAGLDVGIAPLSDTRFNRAKSWLKPLEYSALGVAWVGSQLPEYERLAALGVGAVARKPAAWMRELRRLVDDDSYRIEQVERGREVAAGLTIEGNAWRFGEAWADAAAQL